MRRGSGCPRGTVCGIVHVERRNSPGGWRPLGRRFRRQKIASAMPAIGSATSAGMPAERRGSAYCRPDYWNSREAPGPRRRQHQHASREDRRRARDAERRDSQQAEMVDRIDRHAPATSRNQAPRQVEPTRYPTARTTNAACATPTRKNRTAWPRKAARRATQQVNAREVPPHMMSPCDHGHDRPGAH